MAVKPTLNEDSAFAPGGGQESNRRKLRAIVIGPVVKENLTTGKTKELPDPEDQMASMTIQGKVIEPPFDKLALAMLLENSTSLQPLIEAMAQNIDGFGYRLESRIVKEDDEEIPEEISNQIKSEKVSLKNFLENCCEDITFTELRKRTRLDKESTGEAFWEVIRTTNGDIVGLNHIPSHQIRLGAQQDEFTQYQKATPVLKVDGSVDIRSVTRHKKFRTYIQSSVRKIGFNYTITTTRRFRWFKEFGDPRVLHNETGEFLTGNAADSLPEELRASELIHWKIYSPRTPYGVPRFIGNLVTLYGDRAADEVNYITLENNNVPSMVICVSNGQLTEGSLARIEEFVQHQIQGSDNYSRFLLIEAEGQYDGTDVATQKIDIKPLTSEQMRDQLFQEYSKNNREKVRESFRMPPIFTGRSDDYTRSTADSSRKLADEQIFKPERDEFDKMFNRILAEMKIRYHIFRSNGPNVTDDDDLINVMTGGEKTGAMTPRIARLVLADILGRNQDDIPPLDPEVKLDVPFSLQLAERVKNQGPMDSQLAVKSDFNNPVKDLFERLLDFRDEVDRRIAKRDGE